MIILYDNWYQLNDNGLWTNPIRGRYDAHAFRLLLLGGKARLLSDGDTVVTVSCRAGYKLRLSDHGTHEQNNIIDVITPLIIEL